MIQVYEVGNTKFQVSELHGECAIFEVENLASLIEQLQALQFKQAVRVAKP